ncbi:MAG: hypothetical protein HN616_02520 [Proteobacteria bacterium]|jgi:hypothetical protein|nr:hypothetical protein [Pseudomonadota bacterium]
MRFENGIKPKPSMIMNLLYILVLLGGCATSGGYDVGPGASSKLVKQSAGVSSRPAVPLSVVIPVLDPNIPDDPNEYVAKSIWPELRRAEANRFAVKLRDSLADTEAFGSVRVSPDKTATAHLYVNAKILTSNGEDIEIAVRLVDISGKSLMKKTYKHRVTEYQFEDPRLAGKDLYSTVFELAAKDIAKVARKQKPKRIAELNAIEEMRFAETFSPDYFSNYIRTSSSGKTKLMSLPADDDVMLNRVKSLRIKDQMFVDNMQVDYENFRNDMNEDYILWQKQAFTESKAAREAASAASAKMFLGLLGVVAGAAIANNSSSSLGDYGGAAVAVAGIATIVDGVQDSKEATAHRESLSEMGRSLNIQLAPQVMEMEDRTVELRGNAVEQYTAWRAYLLDVYNKEKTPEIEL